MPRHWTPADILSLSENYQAVCVLCAAADLDVFSKLRAASQPASALATACRANPRAMSVLLDALAALELLHKNADATYQLAPGVGDALAADNPANVLPLIHHRANCLRRWVQLAHVVRTGRPAERTPSVRGAADDEEAFVQAMHTINASQADALIRSLGPPRFTHLLDIGGASGTWTIAFLRANPAARATLFDLPDVIPLARARLESAGFANRVNLVGGDFYNDDLPAGADLAWLSAIAHQNDRAQNRALFGQIFRALAPGGALLIRDVVMEPDRTQPVGGALFAVNMLVATDGGGTYTVDEYREDLATAGFRRTDIIHRDPFMSTVVRAPK